MGSIGSESTRLDVCQLEVVAKELCDSSIAASTGRTYRAAQRIFAEFCLSCGKPSVPASEQLLILFIADLSCRVCYSTARTSLSAIRHMHIAQGHGDPLKGCLQLELVLKGLKRKRPRSQDSRLLITPWVLLQMKRVLNRRTITVASVSLLFFEQHNSRCLLCSSSTLLGI